MQVFLQAPFKQLWQGQDIHQAAEGLQGEVYREVKDRRTLRTEVNGRGYFVKIHRGIGWKEIFKNILSFRLPILGAKNEFLAIQKLQQIGVETMTAVAYSETGCNPAKKHSFIITEELAPTVSLEDYCSSWRSHPPSFQEKRALIKRVAHMVRAMHQAGVNHRDCYICHFLLDTSRAFNPHDFKLSLIDLHRAQIRKSVPKRWRNKDLIALAFSSSDIGLTKSDKIMFLKEYFSLSLRDVLQKEKPFLQLLDKKVEAMTQRQLRYGDAL